MSTILPPTIRQIVIAIDGSEPAAWALRVGKRLASELGAHVTLVHAVEPLFVPAEGVLVSDQEMDAIKQRCGKDLLARAYASVSEYVPVKTVLGEGYAADFISAAAEAEKADLIVIGSRGQGRLSELVLGSTALAVIRESSCPVLTIAHPPSEPSDQEKDWVGVGADSADPLSAHVRLPEEGVAKQAK